MSSIRNAAPRRNHKERGQLANRKKLGLLEKHKDYVLRARDYHAKQTKITRLRVKASERNKDEFYFGMINGRTQKGIHVQERGNVAQPPDVIKILKSQDANYVRTQKAANLRRIDVLKSQLSLLADLLPTMSDLTSQEIKTLQSAGLLSSHSASKGKGKQVVASRRTSGHVVFAESTEQAQAYQPPSPSRKEDAMDEDEDDVRLETVPSIDIESLGWLPSTSSKSQVQKPSSAASDIAVTPDLSPTPLTDEERKSHRSALITELSARLLRDMQLKYALSELELQKVLMGKGGKRKLKEAEEVKPEEKEGEDESDDEDMERKKEQKIWRPRVFKWKFIRRK